MANQQVEKIVSPSRNSLYARVKAVKNQLRHFTSTTVLTKPIIRTPHRCHLSSRARHLPIKKQLIQGIFSQTRRKVPSLTATKSTR